MVLKVVQQVTLFVQWITELRILKAKVKEGLVFDPSSWELIGFTDLGTDDDDLNGLLKGDGSEHSSGMGWRHMCCSFSSKVFLQSLNIHVHTFLPPVLNHPN